MGALTKEELNEQNPEKIYDIPLTLNIEKWKSFNLPVNLMNYSEKLKFNENIRDNMKVIKNKKGIYMFVVEPEFPFVPRIDYLLYIGRVIKSDTFFKRFYNYVKSIGKRNKKRNIQFLTNAWIEKTFVYFFEINDDDKIVKTEEQLINIIIPSLNNQLYLKGAHNPRSILN